MAGGETRKREGETHRHDLSPFPNHASTRTNIHHGAIQAPARLLHRAHHHKHARLRRNTLQLLARAVSPLLLLLQAAAAAAGQLPLHPAVAATAAAVPHRVAQIHRALKVLQELVSPFSRAPADDAPERRPARVAAEVGLGEEQDVDVGARGAGGEGADAREGEGGGGAGGRG